MQDEPNNVQIRKATYDDLDAVAGLIAPFVSAQRLLPRTLNELEELVDTLFVAEVGDRLVGCAALEIYSKKLAEVRSLAVAAEMQGQGVGRLLVDACVQLASEYQVLEVMAITSREDFFRSCGFDFTLPGEKKALFYQTRDTPYHDES